MKVSALQIYFEWCFLKETQNVEKEQSALLPDRITKGIKWEQGPKFPNLWEVSRMDTPRKINGTYY